MISVAELKMMGQPDINGKPFSPVVQEGSAALTHLGDPRGEVTVVISAGTFNVRTATCTGGCTLCRGTTSLAIVGLPSIPIGSTGQFRASAYQSDGNVYDVTGDSLWQTSNGSVVGLNGPGLFSGVAVGSAWITASYNGVVGGVCPSPPELDGGCQTNTFSDSVSVEVIPRLDSISPSRGLINATTASVTLSGQGFSGGHVDTPAAILVSNISTFTDTRIVLDLVVSSDATPGNNQITVTASNVQSTAVNFFVQVPTSLAKAGTATGTSEGLCPGGTACGTIVSFPYQVFDQDSPPQPIRAAMSMWDTFASTFSPDNLQLQGTASFTTCPGNTGPCGVFTGSDGTFTEGALGACSTVCKVNGVCTTGGPSGIDQTWHIAGQPIVQHILDYCEKVVVNGSQIQ